MRIKRGKTSKRKHKKLLNLTKGYRGIRNRTVKQAHEAILHAGSYAYHGRKIKKRDFRTLWNIRIGEAAKENGFSYSVFMNKLRKSKIELDRKILSDLAVNDREIFKKIVDSVKNV
jgi:large subunit ribosomal protein L20